MLGHLGLNVPDLGKAASYYDQLMPLVDYEPYITAEDAVAYKPAEGRRGAYLFFYPALDMDRYDRDAVGLGHLAFIVRTRSAVRAVHDHVVRSGLEVLHVPQEFPQYPPPYYATFWLDPFGFMLEAVCHHDRD
ncbi:MAG TPA: VOC family protein [Acidimicrobiales bacterium]|nr:VOC family protein [Acidimicrobiales bacterium]